MVMPPTAIWNVFPFATEIGWPLKFPNHVRVPAELVRSIDTIDHAPPDPFVHDSALDAGSVTLLPALDAADAAGTTVPPAGYPVPVSSVPAALADEAVLFSRTFIAVPPTALNDPGAPDAPVGVVAFRMLLTMVWSIAAIAVLSGHAANLRGHLRHRHRPGRHYVAFGVQHAPADLRRWLAHIRSQ
jgi:hypothetical protein